MLKRQKNVVFVIDAPDVDKSPHSDTYIVFGEAKVEDLSNSALSQALGNVIQQQKQMGASQADASSSSSAADSGPPDLEADASGANDAAGAGADDAGDVDETGVEPKDIELVMTQTEASRAQAVRALKKANGDIVNAIMELTM